MEYKIGKIYGKKELKENLDFKGGLQHFQVEKSEFLEDVNSFEIEEISARKLAKEYKDVRSPYYIPEELQGQFEAGKRIAFTYTQVVQVSIEPYIESITNFK